jgi:hypothetical protein
VKLDTAQVELLFASDEPKVACTGCQVKHTVEQMGTRRDGRANTRCPRCRYNQASSAGRLGTIKARTETQRDMKALRVVERYVGFRWKEWTTPAGRKAQEAFVIAQGYAREDLWRMRLKPFEELWTARIQRLADRWELCRAARKRIAARNAQPVAEAA